jgi:hypothetical protein
MRLPGTGVGVARLVLVSIVTLDIARPLAVPSLRRQPRPFARKCGNFSAFVASALQVRRNIARRGERNGVEMADRRLATDFGLALLIAFPATLPAAPNPWSASDEVGKPSVADAQADSAFPYDTAAIPDSEFDS